MVLWYWLALLCLETISWQAHPSGRVHIADYRGLVLEGSHEGQERHTSRKDGLLARKDTLLQQMMSTDAKGSSMFSSLAVYGKRRIKA